MWNVIEEVSTPRKLINMVKVSYRNSKSCVQVGRKKTNSFEIETELRQGCLLSPMLFNLISEKVVHSIKEIEGGAILGDMNAKRLAFADDVDLIDREIQNIERMYLPIKETAARMGLEISGSKTKKMILSRNNQQQQQQNLADIENVRKFRYLGSMITARNEMEREVLARIAAGNRCYYSLQQLLKRINVTRPTKLRIYNTIIRPVAIYDVRPGH